MLYLGPSLGNLDFVQVSVYICLRAFLGYHLAQLNFQSYNLNHFIKQPGMKFHFYLKSRFIRFWCEINRKDAQLINPILVENCNKIYNSSHFYVQLIQLGRIMKITAENLIQKTNNYICRVQVCLHQVPLLYIVYSLKREINYFYLIHVRVFVATRSNDLFLVKNSNFLFNSGFSFKFSELA